MVVVRIYFEGDDQLREGFRAFFGELIAGGLHLKLIAGGAGSRTIADFQLALKKHADELNVLLIDSEGPFHERLFEEKCQTQGIAPGHKKKVFWMVQCMESWFLADHAALQECFGRDLRESALRGNPRIEEIPKADVLGRLKAATQGKYHKTRHAPALLKMIDSERVKQASEQCRRLFADLPNLASTARS